MLDGLNQMCVGPKISKDCLSWILFNINCTFENRSKMLDLSKKLDYLCRCKSEISLELNSIRSLSSDQENHESPCKFLISLHDSWATER